MYPDVYVWVCISRVGCAELAKRIISRSMRFVALSPYMVSSRFARFCVGNNRDRIALIYPACW